MISGRLVAGLAIPAIVLIGCSTSGPGETVSSTPVRPSAISPSVEPSEILIDPPDPCSLVDVEKLPQLSKLVAKTPKNGAESSLKTCMWENYQSHHGAYLRVAVSDLRPRAQVPVHRNYDLDCTDGSIVTGSAGKFCLSDDGEGLVIMYHNVYVSIGWATSAITRARPESERLRQANRLSGQLADQALRKLGE
jgi:hypothetical protein